MEVPDEPWEPDEPSQEMLLVRGASERIARPHPHGAQGGADRA